MGGPGTKGLRAQREGAHWGQVDQVESLTRDKSNHFHQGISQRDSLNPLIMSDLSPTVYFVCLLYVFSVFFWFSLYTSGAFVLFFKHFVLLVYTSLRVRDQFEETGSLFSPHRFQGLNSRG